MRVHGLSRHAEQLLGVREDTVVNRPLTELLVPADAEAGRLTGLAAAVADAVGRGEEPLHAFVRPANTFGVRVRARITACGPPRAALVLLEKSLPASSPRRLSAPYERGMSAAQALAGGSVAGAP